MANSCVSEKIPIMIQPYSVLFLFALLSIYYTLLKALRPKYRAPWGTDPDKGTKIRGKFFTIFLLFFNYICNPKHKLSAWNTKSEQKPAAP